MRDSVSSSSAAGSLSAYRTAQKERSSYHPPHSRASPWATRAGCVQPATQRDAHPWFFAWTRNEVAVASYGECFEHGACARTEWRDINADFELHGHVRPDASILPTARTGSTYRSAVRMGHRPGKHRYHWVMKIPPARMAWLISHPVRRRRTTRRRRGLPWGATRARSGRTAKPRSLGPTATASIQRAMFGSGRTTAPTHIREASRWTLTEPTALTEPTTLS
jgi:hypothetical protein